LSLIRYVSDDKNGGIAMKRKRHVKNKQNIEIQTEIQARTYAFGIVFYNRAGKTP